MDGHVLDLPDWARNLRVALGAASQGLTRVYEEMGLDTDGGWVGQALSGARRPSNDELALLAAYTDVPLSVLAGYVAPVDNLKVALRAGLIGLAPQDQNAAERARVLLATLRRLLPLFPAEVAECDRKMAEVREARSGHRYAPHAGRQAAENLRAVLDLTDEPIDELASLIESLGCPVIFTPLPENVHGMTVHDERRGDWRAVILVSTEDWWVRQRYTLAHELCHVIYRDGAPVIVDRKGDVDESDLSEWRAESFARHFLAPTRTVRTVWERHISRGRAVALANVVMHCGISRDAALLAVSDAMGIPRADMADLKTPRVKDLMTQASLSDEWRSACTNQHEPGTSEWLLLMALGAYRDGLAELPTVAEVLGDDDIDRVAADLRLQGWIQAVQ